LSQRELMFSAQAHSLPPGALLSLRKLETDHRAGPQYRERIPFLVVYKGINNRLIDQVVSPEEYFDSGYEYAF
jgi:hypothetical protein